MTWNIFIPRAKNSEADIPQDPGLHFGADPLAGEAERVCADVNWTKSLVQVLVLGLDQSAHVVDSLADADVETVVHHRPPGELNHVGENVDQSDRTLIR